MIIGFLFLEIGLVIFLTYGIAVIHHSLVDGKVTSKKVLTMYTVIGILIIVFIISGLTIPLVSEQILVLTNGIILFFAKLLI